MQVIRNGETSSALAAVPFTSVDDDDLQIRLSGALTFTTRIIKADQTSAVGSGNYDQPDSANAPGCRRYMPSASDTSVNGPAIIRISATGMETREIAVLVLPYAPHADPGARTPGWLPIKKGETINARRSVPFTAVSSTNLQTRLDASLLTFTVRVIKSDGTSAAGVGSVVQPDRTNAQGCCFYVCGDADIDTSGETIIRISASGMETREISVTVVDFDPYEVKTTNVISNAATQESIRDRCYSLVEALTPATDPSVKFRRYRNEWGADFIDAAEKNPAAMFRRFQVRNLGNDEPPEVSNMVHEERRLTLEILIAYPQDHRAGKDNALDRDDIIEEDWDYINFNIGICGRANFFSTHDCTPIGCTKEIERGQGVDFMVIRAEFIYQRALAVGGLAQGG